MPVDCKGLEILRERPREGSSPSGRTNYLAQVLSPHELMDGAEFSRL